MDLRSVMSFAALVYAVLSANLAHANERGLVVKVQKQQYARNEIAEIEVRNQSSHTLRFIAYAEVWDKGQWFAWPYRLEDGRTDVLPHLRELESGQGLFVHLRPDIAESPDVCPLGQSLPEPANLRFRVCTRVELNSESLSAVADCTQAFDMHFPYGG